MTPDEDDALPFTDEDHDAVIHWAAVIRPHCVKVALEMLPDDTLERGFVWMPGRHLEDDPRWTFSRDQEGLWIEDYDDDSRTGPFEATTEALELVSETLEAEMVRQVEGIPVLSRVRL